MVQTKSMESSFHTLFHFISLFIFFGYFIIVMIRNCMHGCCVSSNAHKPACMSVAAS